MDDTIQAMIPTVSLFGESLERFAIWANEWKRLQERKIALPKDEASTADKAKLQQLQEIVRDQLREFGFQSVKPDSIEISNESYRPTREGFNLGFDLSASDNIRLIWAYLHGLLEVARDAETNHAGLLIFDEPKQQDTAEMSFSNLLKRASRASAFGQQVLLPPVKRPLRCSQ